MSDRQPRTGDGDAAGAGPRSAAHLRARLDQAQVGERRAQALLESAASLMSLSETEAVLTGLAENAVRHVGLQRVSVYRADHDAGTLIEVARAEMEERPASPPLPGMARVRMLETGEEPIALGPGDPLGEFALGDEPHVLRPATDERGEAAETLLVQMRAGKRWGSEGGTTLVGVIAARSDVGVTPRQVNLLRALATLGAAATEAARAEEFRSELVSSVSHELRTPLAAIRAYNELLLDGDAGEINEEQRLFLERIEVTCLALDRIVEDLLDLSRLRAGEIVVRKRPVDVVAVIEHIIDTLSPEAARREVTLSEEIEPELPMISSNSDRLAQVLFNLVGNAVKYVGEGGEVVVHASVRNAAALPGSEEATGEETERGGASQCLVIEVVDNGPGIAPDEKEKIFEEFYRGRQTEGKTKGSGLGLSIARRLTRLLGGVLEVESAPEEGSTFSLLFPLPQDESGETEES